MSVIKKAKYFVKGQMEKPKYLYSPEDHRLFEEFVNDKIGKVEKVYHELYSPDIHLDILIIPPSPESNYYKLVTDGLGAYRMNIPDIVKDERLERAELVLYLPPDWNMNFSKEENGWVIRHLKVIARTPIMENGWIGFGHSFDEGNQPFASNTKLSNSILLNALDKDFNYLDLQLPNNEKINFYQVFPLYKEELDYVYKNGIEALTKLFSDEDLFPIATNRNYLCNREGKIKSTRRKYTKYNK